MSEAVEEQQRTIVHPVSIEGVGLHTGDDCRLNFYPGEADSGYVFRRIDLPGRPEIRPLAENVTDTSRGTTISANGAEIHTVEHILSALYGLGIDNAVIELDSHEPPVVDGSARPFVKILREAGRKPLDAPRRYIVPREPLVYASGTALMILAPTPGPTKLSFSLHFDHPVLRSQYREFTLDEQRFCEEIAPARTFCFLHEVSLLRQAGLIKGGSLECAVVIGDEEVINDNLRYSDEFVRHKLLDLLGDLTLVGAPLKAQVVSIKGGHTANVGLALALRRKLGLTD